MLGILCGLASEAALLRSLDGLGGIVMACAGARPQQARWLARDLVKRGATRLLSFGIAGALEPGLPTGSLVIGTQIAAADQLTACQARWIDQLAQSLPTAHCGPVWGSETVIATLAAKRALYERSRCLTVDMESHCVAQVATEARLALRGPARHQRYQRDGYSQPGRRRCPRRRRCRWPAHRGAIPAPPDSGRPAAARLTYPRPRHREGAGGAAPGGQVIHMNHQ